MTGVQLPHVAFIGKTGAGKTTCAKALIDSFRYERLSFAAPLKTGCGTTDDRTLLQTVGQGVRDLYPDFWVNLLLDDLRRRDVPDWEQPKPRFVVDDCRYPNEAQALKAAGFTIVRVTASVAERTDRQRRAGRLQDEAQLHHVSETALDDFVADHRIVNDGWLDELLADLTDFINAVRS